VEARTRRAGVASGPPPKLTSASPQPDPDPDPAGAVVLDTVLALRQIVRERGLLPFDFAGLRAGEALSALEQTLDRCLVKKGMRA